MDASPADPRARRAARGAPLLHPGCHRRQVDDPRAGAPAPHPRVPSEWAPAGKSVISADTNASHRDRGVQERLQPGVPRAARRLLRGRSPWLAAPQPRPLHHRARPRLLLRRIRVPDPGREPGLRHRPGVLPPGPDLPGRLRAQGPQVRARRPRAAELLPRGARPRCEEAARATFDRRLAVRDEGRQGRRVRARSHDLAGAGRPVSFHAAFQGAAAPEAPRAVHPARAGRSGSRAGGDRGHWSKRNRRRPATANSSAKP